MRIALIILFVLLYLGNYYICDYFYPNSDTIEADWYKWDDLRRTLYEAMFLILCIVSFWNQTVLSRSLAVGVAFLVLCSLIDKIGGIFSYQIHDVIVIVGGVFISQRTYSILKKNEEKTNH